MTHFNCNAMQLNFRPPITLHLESAMSRLLKLCLLFGIFTISHASETEKLETFIEGIIETWQLQSPTILFKNANLETKT